jgi:Domain of unknown function (DUF3597)
MSIFGSIVSAIFGSSKPAGAAPTAAPTGSSTPTPTSAAPAAPAAAPMTQQDVEAVIQKLASGQREHYDWKVSIVDLMKLLNLDSSLGARKQLAQELGYTGALDGSADMNIWLHKQVMLKLAEGGGQVPADLKKF